MVLAFLRAPTNVRFGVSAFAPATGGSSAVTMTRIPAKNGVRSLGALPMKLATTALALKLAPMNVRSTDSGYVRATAGSNAANTTRTAVWSGVRLPNAGGTKLAQTANALILAKTNALTTNMNVHNLRAGHV